MRKFLESKGALVKQDYIPNAPKVQLVNAFENHGIGGPDPNTPCISPMQTFRGKWNKEVVEILMVGFILEVKKGMYKSVQDTWPQMAEDQVRKRCQKKLYCTGYSCRTCRMRPRSESDKVNRMNQRRQNMGSYQDLILTLHKSLTERFIPQTYLRRRRIYELNFNWDPGTWKDVGLLLDGLGTRGISDDKTDHESEYAGPDLRFKTLRCVDLGFLNPVIADIWAAVESYPASLCPSRGNRSFKHIPVAKSISKKCMPLAGLPINFYNPRWLEACPHYFQKHAKADVPLPALVGDHTSEYLMSFHSSA